MGRYFAISNCGLWAMFLSFFLAEVSVSGAIRGRVIDPAGNPIAEAGIYVEGYDWIVYTDSAGMFITPEVPAGEYSLKAQRFGWTAVVIRVIVPSAGLVTAEDITLAYGDLDGNGDIDLRDVVSMDEKVGQPTCNASRYLDVNGNNIVDSIEFELQLEGFSTQTEKVDEWSISKPDFKTYLPYDEKGDDATNQHYLVSIIGGTRLFGIWTQAFEESSTNQRMVCHWSDNDGANWSRLVQIDGPSIDGRIASWGFSIYSEILNRVYVFYCKDIGTRVEGNAEMWARYSDDLGLTWSQPYAYKFRRGEYSPTDTTIPPAWWAYQNPIIIGGKAIVGFTEIQNVPGITYYSTEIRFLVFENILTEPDPSKLKIETYPVGSRGLRGSYQANTLRSTLQEPSIVQLSDGRLFCVMRSGQGFPYYAISADTGRNWTTPKPLLFGDNQPVIPQPLASCPLFKLSDGHYILVFHNNDGTANGGFGPSDLLKNRTPAFMAVAKETLSAQQPLRFLTPIRLLENYVRPRGPQQRTEIATYPSLTDHGDHYVLWYPDRKHFLLGKKLPKPITKLLAQ